MGFRALISVIALLGAGCAGNAAPVQRNPWTTPHVLTISDASDPDSLNPHIGSSPPTANLSEMTMAWLVRWDDHNQPVPELATEIPSRTNGGVSADGRTITYHLRRGVVWSDGAPFNADDVVFSANTVNNPANHETVRFDQLASAVATDKYTVVFHLKKPYSAFVEGLFSSCCANPSLLPKHILVNTATSTTRRTIRCPSALGHSNLNGGITGSKSCLLQTNVIGADDRNSIGSSIESYLHGIN